MQRYTIRFLTFISVLSFSFFSCKSTNKDIGEHTYFGGEIVNPNTNYIVLSKDNAHHDTIYLDKNNRFFHKVENLKEGIYSFKHNPENQILILEKGDSILIRLNTLEFDESLVFTGRGAVKNNFLIDMFLQNETERKRVENTDFKQTPIAFKKNQDSLLRLRLKAFDRLTSKHNLSNLAQKLAESSFMYDFYSRYEMYFYRHFGMTSLDPFKDLPKSFFVYRKDVDYNDDDLKRLYSYHQFLNNHIINSSYCNYIKTKTYPKNQAEITVNELSIIDSIITHPYIKNNLLRGFTAKFLLESEDHHSSNEVLKHYLAKSTNKKFQKELKKLSRSTSRLKPNNIIPDQDLIKSDGETIRLSSLFVKPVTALYFWSIESKNHYVRAHKKASYLSTIYPEIDFIAINTDAEQTKNWLKTIKRHHYNLGYEYEFKYPKCSSEELVIHYRNKVILVDLEGRIINANADLFSTTFEDKLMRYTSFASLQK
ncbi:hypothetical protein [Aquimarina sp. MMG016]|uniref:TlpA family protein disulfide reductase n=1 Tax=Aquimarina sp. MMG016 TaxID=2822690 RepID=UPI001B3A1D14|nr:hypothetical protein [Aquimarina sp. MMG016]MBQ4821990.1 hypothetical protein [Aquimarina sp. MMG016]